MPALELEVIGHCSYCKLRSKLNNDLTMPWHPVGIFTCDGVDKPAVDIERPKPEGKRPAPVLAGKRGRK